MHSGGGGLTARLHHIGPELGGHLLDQLVDLVAPIRALNVDLFNMSAGWLVFSLRGDTKSFRWMEAKQSEKNGIDCSCFLSRGETERGKFPGIISPFTEMTGEDEQGARGEGGIVIPCMFL